MTTHTCPPEGSLPTRCCDRLLYELPPGDRIVADPAAVTCKAAAAQQPKEA